MASAYCDQMPFFLKGGRLLLVGVTQTIAIASVGSKNSLAEAVALYPGPLVGADRRWRQLG